MILDLISKQEKFGIKRYRLWEMRVSENSFYKSHDVHIQKTSLHLEMDVHRMKSQITSGRDGLIFLMG